MARGPHFFSPAVQSAPWSYESTSNDVQMMPMQDIRLTFISGSYPICRAVCSTKPQRIVSNLHGLFFQTLSAGRIWDITKGCSTPRPRRMKTSTSSSLASLVGHLELLRKEPAYDHMRALLTTIIDHLGINTGRKRKGQDDTTKPNKTHAALANSKFARVQVDSLPKLSVRSIFGPNSRPALDTSKTRWDKDRLGFHNPKPKIYDEASLYRANAIRQSANFWDGRSLVASPKDSLTFRTQEISLSDEDRRDERLRAPPRAELLHHAESLPSSTKSVVLYEREPVIVEEDRAEQIPEVMSTEDNHGLELEIDHPPRDARNVQPEPVCNVPPKPAVGPALRRIASLLPIVQVMMRTAACSTTPTVSRCVLGRTLVTARTKLL